MFTKSLFCLLLTCIIKESDGGLYVCLNDFLGFALKYVDLHYQKTKNGIYLQIVNVPKPVCDVFSIFFNI